MRRKLDRFGQLLGDVFGHQLSLQLRPADFFNLQIDAAADQVLQLLLQQLDLLTLLADDQTGPSHVQHDLHFVARPLDLDLVDAGVAILRLLGMVLDEVANLLVLDQQRRRNPASRRTSGSSSRA